MPRTETSGWTGEGRGGRFGTVIHKPPPPPVVIAAKGAAPMAGVTQPPPNPITNKPYRPGERLERQARQFAKRPPARVRNYEALIARALEGMGFEED